MPFPPLVQLKRQKKVTPLWNVNTIIVFHPLPSFCQDFLQSCAIQFKLNNKTRTIASIYSPTNNISNTQFTEYFSTIKNNCIIGGAKHQS